jgi:hypothetical protein
MLPMGHLEAGTKSTVPIRSFLLCSFVIRSWWCSHLGVNVYSLLRHVRGTGNLPAIVVKDSMTFFWDLLHLLVMILS